jgi:hypothetical protein
MMIDDGDSSVMNGPCSPLLIVKLKVVFAVSPLQFVEVT